MKGKKNTEEKEEEGKNQRRKTANNEGLTFLFSPSFSDKKRK